MSVVDILNSPWAILPDKLIQLEEVYSRYLRAEHFTPEQIIEAIGERKELLNDLPKADKIAAVIRENADHHILGFHRFQRLNRAGKVCLSRLGVGQDE